MAYESITPTKGTAILKGSEFKITKEVPYGSTLGATTGGFHTIIQTAWGYPNRIEDLRHVMLRNTGKVTLELQFLIETWTDGTPDSNGAAIILKTLIPSGEEMYLPTLRMLAFNATTSSADAYVLNNKRPEDIDSGNLYQEVDALDDSGEEAADTTITVDVGSKFSVGDLIQLGINTTTATRQEIMRVTGIATHLLTVERALYGTSAADKDAQTNATSGAVDNAKVYLPFFNILEDSGEYGGFSTCQTNSSGKFHIMNFFGYGRYASQAGSGIVSGSVSGKFYSQGYQALGMTGVTSSTNSGLTASTAYALDIQVDGATNFDNLTFTTDSSNVNWGGTNGIISKIQAVLDTQYYTAGNLFEKKVTVAIVNGDVRFTSGSNLTTSAIALTAEDGSDASFFGTGRIPAIGNIKAAVAARVPNDLYIDKVSGTEKRNESVFFYDDGNGNIKGTASGYINIETGEFFLENAPSNANFVISANYGSASAGGIKTISTANRNSIYEVKARSTNQKIAGQIEFIGYEN